VKAPDGQDLYALDVLNLIHVATEIRAGRGAQLATKIQNMLAGHLNDMLTFSPSPYRTLAFFRANQLYTAAGASIPTELQTATEAADKDAPQLLSDDCCGETTCQR
jgi:hypothetical protein